MSEKTQRNPLGSLGEDIRKERGNEKRVVKLLHATRGEAKRRNVPPRVVETTEEVSLSFSGGRKRYRTWDGRGRQPWWSANYIIFHSEKREKKKYELLSEGRRRKWFWAGKNF